MDGVEKMVQELVQDLDRQENESHQRFQNLEDMIHGLTGWWRKRLQQENWMMMIIQSQTEAMGGTERMIESVLHLHQDGGNWFI